MSVRNWLILLVIYIANLFIGMALFHIVECPAELEGKREKEEREEEVREKVHSLDITLTKEQRKDLEQILKYFGDPGLTLLDGASNSSDPICTKWDNQNSLFFAFTVVTTIGQSATD